MYLIFRVISNNRIIIRLQLITESTSKYTCGPYKRAIYLSNCLRLTFPLIQKNGYTKEYVTPTSLAIYKIPQKSELHSPTQYDCRGVLQS
jgi:hypothetical protein